MPDVPQLPKWPLLQLTTSTYIGSSAAVYVFVPCIPADLVPDHLVVGTARKRDNTHDRYAVYQDLSLYASWAVQPLPSNVLARVHPWVSFEKAGYLSVVRARHGYDRL